jgi:hypothetical protein
MSTIANNSGTLEPQANTAHIHLTGASFNLDKNSANDELRLAFSVINRLNNNNTPDKVRIVVEFASDDTNLANRQYASLQVELAASELSTNRYVVLSKTLEDLVKSAEFSWTAISIVKIYVSVLDNTDTPDPDYYVALDAIRFENLNTPNSLYGLTGYSVVRTSDGRPIVKESNTSNLVEFRFAMDVA